MARDAAKAEKLRVILNQITSLTESGNLRWERQLGSAHRYANYRGNLLILGPAQPLSETKVPRYLFITPYDSPACIEINSDDAELGDGVLKLVDAVETATEKEPPTDPFAIDHEVLSKLAES